MTTHCDDSVGWKIAHLPSFPNQTKLLKEGGGRERRGGGKEAGELHIVHFSVGAEYEQQGSCVRHECINKSLTSETQPWKDIFNVCLLV